MFSGEEEPVFGLTRPGSPILSPRPREPVRFGTPRGGGVAGGGAAARPATSPEVGARRPFFSRDETGAALRTSAEAPEGGVAASPAAVGPRTPRRTPARRARPTFARQDGGVALGPRRSLGDVEGLAGADASRPSSARRRSRRSLRDEPPRDEPSSGADASPRPSLTARRRSRSSAASLDLDAESPRRGGGEAAAMADAVAAAAGRVAADGTRRAVAVAVAAAAEDGARAAAAAAGARPSDVVAALLRVAAAGANCDGAVLYVASRDGASLYPVASTFPADADGRPGARSRIGQSVAAELLRPEHAGRDAPLVVADARAHASFNRRRDVDRGYDTRNLCVCALRSAGGDLVGALEAVNRVADDDDDDGDGGDEALLLCGPVGDPVILKDRRGGGERHATVVPFDRNDAAAVGAAAEVAAAALAPLLAGPGASRRALKRADSSLNVAANRDAGAALVANLHRQRSAILAAKAPPAPRPPSPATPVDHRFAPTPKSGAKKRWKVVRNAIRFCSVDGRSFAVKGPATVAPTTPAAASPSAAADAAVRRMIDGKRLTFPPVDGRRAPTKTPPRRPAPAVPPRSPTLYKPTAASARRTPARTDHAPLGASIPLFRHAPPFLL